MNKLPIMTEIAPPIPSKYDIIPIHASDAATFKFCRRKWSWSSPMRLNLAPKVSQIGVDINFWFGTGCHYALAQNYDPRFQRDLVEAFVSWFEITYRGGIVTAAEAELSYDPKPRPVEQNGTQYFKVEGLYDMLPDTYDPDVFEEHKELGINMLKFYRDYSAANDDFRVLVAEHTFSIPILDPITGEVLRAIDPRDGVEKDVHARGTQDAIIQRIATGAYGILEHKTAIDITEGYFEKLDKDEQCTRYLWAGQREAEINDLDYKKLSFVLYNALRKAYPKPPTPLKSGLFSIDRSKESTTYEFLTQYIRENNLEIIIANDQKRLDYIEYVKEAGDEQFIERKLVTRNQYEIESCGERIWMEASDMLDPGLRVYPNPTGNWGCLRCTFRGPCIAKDDGSDWDTMLNDNYELNKGR